MRKRWTESDIALLRELWPTSYATDLTEIFGCCSDCINQKARHIGLKKSPSFNGHTHYGIYVKKGNHQ